MHRFWDSRGRYYPKHWPSVFLPLKLQVNGRVTRRMQHLAHRNIWNFKSGISESSIKSHNITEHDDHEYSKWEHLGIQNLHHLLLSPDTLVYGNRTSFADSSSAVKPWHDKTGQEVPFGLSTCAWLSGRLPKAPNKVHCSAEPSGSEGLSCGG